MTKISGQYNSETAYYNVRYISFVIMQKNILKRLSFREEELRDLHDKILEYILEYYKEETFMSYQRKIRFRYCKIVMLKREKNPNKHIVESELTFDFVIWAAMVNKEKKEKIAISFDGIKARIDEISYNKITDLWGMRLLKLRDKNIPAKAKDKEAARVVELEDGEYIGEDLFLLYDQNTGIAMIQQNRMSLGLSRIEHFLQLTYSAFVSPDDKIEIQIRPILELDKGKRLSGDFKQIELSLANVCNYIDDKTSLGTLLKPLQNYNGVNATIKISLGRSKKTSLDRLAIRKLTDELSMDINKKFVKSASIKIQDDSEVEIIDLFEENCHDYLMVDAEEKELLKYEYIIKQMIKKYTERKNELIELII